MMDLEVFAPMISNGSKPPVSLMGQSAKEQTW